jgi:uncharacterized protein
LDEVVPKGALRRLRTFRRSVERQFPGRIIEILLFGSRARGDSRPDSDYDVAVLIRNLEDRRAVDHALTDLAYPHILAGVHIRPVALPETYLTVPQRGTLALRIAQDGVAIH